MPRSMVRLSAGRLGMSESDQALCFLSRGELDLRRRQAPDHPQPRRRPATPTLFDHLGLTPMVRRTPCPSWP